MLKKITDIRFLQGILVLIVCILGLGIFLHRPFWGLMDDASYVLFLIPEIHEQGLFKMAWNYGIGDMSWGMFRPTLPIMAYLIYSPGMVFGPTATYLLNGFVCLLVLYAYSSILARVVKIPVEWILLCCAGFFYQYDWFQFPSLQEKLVYTAGCSFLWMCWQWNSLPKFFRWPLLITVIVIGTATKASILIHFSVGFWLFIVGKEALDLTQIRKRTPEILVLGCLLVASFLFLGNISKHGGYTASFSFAKVLPNLLSKNGLLFSAGLALSLVFSFVHQKTLQQRPALLAPTIGVLGFLALFLPWGIQGYIQSNVGPLFCAMIVLSLNGLSPERWRPLWLLAFMFAALVVAPYRAYTMFKRLNDIGYVAHHLNDLEQKSIYEVWMPCLEGADSMNHYSKKIFGAKVKFSFLKEPADLRGKTLFYDHASCKLPESVDGLKGCSPETIFASSWSRSFQLTRMNCSANNP